MGIIHAQEKVGETGFEGDVSTHATTSPFRLQPQPPPRRDDVVQVHRVAERVLVELGHAVQLARQRRSAT